MMTPERTEKFKRVASKRQANLTVVLENVHDLHNIGAVMRTCDSVGIQEIFILNTESHLTEERIHLAAKSSSGARKWVDVNFYTKPKPCFEHLRKKYEFVLCTHMAEDSKSLYDLDLTTSVALLFGNEHAGVTKETLELCDGNFLIPQVGMVQSLNISVACAVSIYEAKRQRLAKGFYEENPTMTKEEQAALYDTYARRHELKIKNKFAPRLND